MLSHTPYPGNSTRHPLSQLSPARRIMPSPSPHPGTATSTTTTIISSSDLVQIYDPHQRDPGQPSTIQKRRCRTIVAMALIIWGLFITIYVFITSPDDPARCNEFNICNNHYLMFFVGPILLFTGCSMACYNFMTYGGCCHSIKSCGSDNQRHRCGFNDPSGRDITMIPPTGAIRNYLAGTASVGPTTHTTGMVVGSCDRPPSYQTVVAEPWKFLDATTVMLTTSKGDDHMLRSYGPESSTTCYPSEKSPSIEKVIYNGGDQDRARADSMEDFEPPPYHVITGFNALARTSISTQTGNNGPDDSSTAPEYINYILSRSPAINSTSRNGSDTVVQVRESTEIPKPCVPITILLPPERPILFLIDHDNSNISSRRFPSPNNEDPEAYLKYERSEFLRPVNIISSETNPSSVTTTSSEPVLDGMVKE